MSEKFLSNSVFVIGYPKSGTSLLHALLDNNEQTLTIPEETQFFTRIFETFDFKKSDQELIPQFLDALKNVSGLRYLNENSAEDSIRGNYDYSDFDYPKFEEIVSNYLNEKGFSGERCFQAVAKGVQEVNGDDAEKLVSWVEKTPRHYLYIDEIIATFGQPKFIYVVRDPRDNWVSYHKKKGLPLKDFCYTWNKSTEIAQRAQERLTSNFMIIKYEDMVVNPEQAMRKIATFIGLDFTEGLLTPSKNGIPWHGNSMWGERGQQISTAPIGRFKDKAKEEDVKMIEAVLESPMKTFGYEPVWPNQQSVPVSYRFTFLKRNILRKVKHGNKTFK